MSFHPGTPWHHAGSWRGNRPHRAVLAWVVASGLGGLMLAALLLAPPVSTPSHDAPTLVVTTR
ncbi:hypothetical protein ITJ38_02370 [Agreia pratensis]|uniref:hypothetical protein n=1 Tax=Agreia pratensis TaxID=150121 RepID=UPI000A1CA34A|nr:hypothetical protein [Agreia pratensis]MBF4633241.1 hypothetical protein [Agreia pratensis]